MLLPSQDPAVVRYTNEAIPDEDRKRWYAFLEGVYENSHAAETSGRKYLPLIREMWQYPISYERAGLLISGLAQHDGETNVAQQVRIALPLVASGGPVTWYDVTSLIGMTGTPLGEKLSQVDPKFWAAYLPLMEQATSRVEPLRVEAALKVWVRGLRRREPFEQVQAEMSASAAEARQRARGDVRAQEAVAVRGRFKGRGSSFLDTDSHQMGSKIAPLLSDAENFLVQRIKKDPSLRIVIHGRDAEVLYELLRRDPLLTDKEWKRISYVISSRSLGSGNQDVSDILSARNVRGMSVAQARQALHLCLSVSNDRVVEAAKYILYLKEKCPPGALHVDTGYRGSVPKWIDQYISPVGEIWLMSVSVDPDEKAYGKQIPTTTDHYNLVELTEEAPQRLRGEGTVDGAPRRWTSKPGGRELWSPASFWSRVYGAAEALGLPVEAYRNSGDLVPVRSTRDGRTVYLVGPRWFYLYTRAKRFARRKRAPRY